MKKQPKQPQLLWREKSGALTLEGEPVLSYTLAWPELRGAGLGGRWISLFYANLAAAWEKRWRTQVYWQACIQLSQCRAASRPFSPWSGTLAGSVTVWEQGRLSIQMDGEEVRGDGRPLKVRWGDVWNVKEGAPCRLKEFFPGNRRWKRAVAAQVLRQGEERRASGDCFLDPDFAQKAARLLPLRDFLLSPDGVELPYPQCSLAPAAEGTPMFQIPLEKSEFPS